MKVNEAISALTQVANIFRASQDLIEALEVARQVESHKAAFEAEVRDLEEARAGIGKQRDALELERVKLDAKLGDFRKAADLALADVAHDEQLKRDGYARQTQEFIAQENTKREELEQITLGLQARRNALEWEIHQLEDKRDELSGLPVAAPSAQVRLPHE